MVSGFPPVVPVGCTAPARPSECRKRGEQSWLAPDVHFLAAEVGGFHVGVARQLLGAAAEDDASGVQHVAAMSDPERAVGVLLDEQQGSVDTRLISMNQVVSPHFHAAGALALISGGC